MKQRKDADSQPVAKSESQPHDEAPEVCREETEPSAEPQVGNRSEAGLALTATETASQNGPLDTWIQIADVGSKILLGVAGLWFAFIFHAQQQRATIEMHAQEQKTATRIHAQQQQAAAESERIRLQMQTREIELQKSHFAASLIEPLLSENHKRRLLALSLLEQVDENLAYLVSDTLAEADSSPEVRKEADQVRESLRPRRLDDKLGTARKFFDIGKWEAAVQYFQEAVKLTEPSRLDSARLEEANVYFERRDFHKAAEAYRETFEGF